MELTESDRIQQKNTRTKEIKNMKTDVPEVETLSNEEEHTLRVKISECPEIEESFSLGFSYPGANQGK